MLAWDRTPGELLEYIRAYRDRRENDAYMLFNLAGTIAHMCFGKEPIRPWEAFPGAIRPRDDAMSGEEIYSNLLSWCAALDDKGEEK